MEFNETIIAYEDVTGTIVHFSAKQIDHLIRLLTPDQRRFTKILANTIMQPHEIWQSWVEDGSGQGSRSKRRTYVKYLGLSNAGIDASFGVSMAHFVYRSRWELQGLDVDKGEQKEVMEKINGTIRTGSIAYSSTQG